MLPSAFAGAFVPSSPFHFPSQLKPLKRDLRADRPFDPDDRKTVSDALSTLGVSDGDLFSSIKKFQKDHGLKVDGWMKPNGPTQKTLNAVLAGGIGAGLPQGKDKADWLTQYALPQDIVGFDFDKGEAGRNSPGDLMKIKRGFGALIPGKLGRLFEDQPDDFGETVDLIKAIQRGAGLKESGWMAPGDDTTKAYAASLRQFLPQLEDGRSDELAAGDAGPSLWQRLRGDSRPAQEMGRDDRGASAKLAPSVRIWSKHWSKKTRAPTSISRSTATSKPSESVSVAWHYCGRPVARKAVLRAIRHGRHSRLSQAILNHRRNKPCHDRRAKSGAWPIKKPPGSLKMPQFKCRPMEPTQSFRWNLRTLGLSAVMADCAEIFSLPWSTWKKTANIPSSTTHPLFSKLRTRRPMRAIGLGIANKLVSRQSPTTSNG